MILHATRGKVHAGGEDSLQKRDSIILHGVSRKSDFIRAICEDILTTNRNSEGVNDSPDVGTTGSIKPNVQGAATSSRHESDASSRNRNPPDSLTGRLGFQRKGGFVAQRRQRRTGNVGFQRRYS